MYSTSSSRTTLQENGDATASPLNVSKCMVATPAGLLGKRRIVFGEQIHAVLIHADSLTLGMLGQDRKSVV